MLYASSSYGSVTYGGVADSAINATVTPSVLTLTITLPFGSGSEGPHSPSTISSQFGDLTGSPSAWSNPNNSQASDDSYAIAITDSGDREDTQYLQATDFGFAIPSGATVEGILVEVESKLGSGTATWGACIIKGGAVQYATGTNDGATNAITITEAYASIPATGGSSALWGQSWTPTDINSSGFGVSIQSARPFATFQVDHIRITVYYATPSYSVVTTSNATITPAALSVALTSPAATLSYDHSAVPSTLGFGANLPAVTVIVDVDVVIEPAVIAAATSVPTATVAAQRNVSVTPNALSLAATIAIASPSAGVTTGAGAPSATATAPAPTVIVEVNVTVIAEVQALSASPTAPGVAFDYSTAMSLAFGTFSLPAAAIVADRSAVIEPAAQVVTLSAEAPAIAHDYTIQVSAFSGTLTLPSAAVVEGTEVVVTPQTQGIAASLGPFAVQADFVTAPSVQTISTAIPSHTVIAEQIFPATELQATWTVLPPVILTPDVSIQPDVLSLTLSNPASSQSTGVTVQTSTVGAAFSSATASITTDTVLVAQAVAANGAVPAATIVTDQVLEPSPLSASFSSPSRAVWYGATLYPLPSTFTVSAPSPAVLAGAAKYKKGIVVLSSRSNRVMLQSRGDVVPLSTTKRKIIL